MRVEDSRSAGVSGQEGGRDTPGETSKLRRGSTFGCTAWLEWVGSTPFTVGGKSVVDSASGFNIHHY